MATLKQPELTQRRRRGPSGTDLPPVDPEFGQVGTSLMAVLSLPATTTTTATTATTTKVSRAAGTEWASDADWDRHRTTLTRLYMKENKRLWQIVDYMGKEHQFYATPKMYKTRFKRWGLWKNTQAADVAEILRQTAGASKANSEKTESTGISGTPGRDDYNDGRQQKIFLVNGKQVDARRVERYIRNRCRQNGLRPDELSATLVRAAMTASTSRARTIPLSFHIGLGMEESAYSAVRCYYEGSLMAGRWVFASEADCDMATPQGLESGRITGQFFERFKTVAQLLALPPGTAQAAEGLRMARICFAELPLLLNNSLGPEDPILLVLVLIVLQHVRNGGETLRWMEERLARYIADLAGSLPQARPSARVWMALRDLVVRRELTDRISLQMSKVAIEASRRHLGPLHAKTVELTACGHINFDNDAAVSEARMVGLLADLDALCTFDERHAGLRWSLATLYQLHGMYDKAFKVCLDVVTNPWMLEQSKRYRSLTYKLYLELGNSSREQGRLCEAEGYLRQGIAVAKWEASEKTGNHANVLEGLLSLEECLRLMGEHGAADDVVAEREMWIREGLENVGEEE